MGLEGYTGPTSGRITIGGGDNPEIKRESFTQKSDPLLTRDEAEATAWFRALPPNEQFREVRRLEWNTDEQLKRISELREELARQELEIRRINTEMQSRRPDRFEPPRAAAELLSLAELHGWRSVKGWTPAVFTDEDGSFKDDPEWFRFEIAMTDDQGTTFKLSWSVPRDGNGRGSMIRSGLARSPGRNWHDAPSLKKIKIIISEGGS